MPDNDEYLDRLRSRVITRTADYASCSEDSVRKILTLLSPAFSTEYALLYRLSDSLSSLDY